MARFEAKTLAPKVDLPVETKASPFALPVIISWLETKDPTETYNKNNPEMCLFGQLAEALNVEKPVGLHTYMAAIAFGPTPDPLQTYGAALARASKIAAR